MKRDDLAARIAGKSRSRAQIKAAQLYLGLTKKNSMNAI